MTTVLISGSFDILNRGHLFRIRTAAELGDRLVIGVWPDSSVHAYQDEIWRWEVLRGLTYANEVIIQEEIDPTAIIAAEGATIFCLGDERQTLPVPREALAAVGAHWCALPVRGPWKPTDEWIADFAEELYQERSFK